MQRSGYLRMCLATEPGCGVVVGGTKFHLRKVGVEIVRTRLDAVHV
jgi:hypothetical protein